MASRRPHRIVAIAAACAAAVAVVTIVTALVGQTGCAGNCGTNCPNATVYIGNLDGQQLSIDEILVDGPACPPPYGIYCAGDGPYTTCTHVTITGRAPGFCDVLIAFHDRPAEIVRTQFGPPIQQGCCKGYTIIGDSVFVIPANPDAGISGVDGGTDAVTIVVDAGANDVSGDVVDAGANDASGDSD
jgi:hypothetical protein